MKVTSSPAKKTKNSTDIEIKPAGETLEVKRIVEQMIKKGK